MSREAEIDKRRRELLGKMVSGDEWTAADQAEFHMLQVERARLMKPRTRKP